jgi:hypothetical protein
MLRANFIKATKRNMKKEKYNIAEFKLKQTLRQH